MTADNLIKRNRILRRLLQNIRFFCLQFCSRQRFRNTVQNYLPASFCSLSTDHCSLKKPPRAKPSGVFRSAAAATAAGVGRSATGVAGEGENYENGDDDPDKALVVVKKSAKAVVIHGRPPKVFLRNFVPR